MLATFRSRLCRHCDTRDAAEKPVILSQSERWMSKRYGARLRRRTRVGLHHLVRFRTYEFRESKRIYRPELFRFLETVPVFWWKYKWSCGCFAKAALKDDKDPRVAMLKGGIIAQMGPSSVPNHMVPLA